MHRALALGRAAALAAAFGGTAWAQDAARGAEFYMRLPNDTRSCVSCHGPDPGLSHNNILRAADNPNGLTQALNTVSAMGFLRASLSDADRADIAAFLGTVARLRADTSLLTLWPITLEFGTVPGGAGSAVQSVQLGNPSASQPLLVGALASSNPAFELGHDCPASLPPGAQCTLQLRLKPAVAGLLRASLRVGEAASANARYVGLSGYGAAGPASALEWRPAATVQRFDAPGADGLQRRTLLLANPGPMPAVLAASSLAGPAAGQFRVESGCAAGMVLVAGTQCEMVLAYTASRLPLAQAVLQMRSDQGNPAAVRLEGVAAAEPPPPVPPVLPEGGGGCSVGPPGRGLFDPVLVLAAWLAAAALQQRGRRPSGRKGHRGFMALSSPGFLLPAMRQHLLRLAAYWTRDSRVERIRRQMLDEMRPSAASPGHAELQQRLARAADAHALWLLRPELRELLSQHHPDQVVQFKMASISFLFAGLLRRAGDAPLSTAEPQRNFV